MKKLALTLAIILAFVTGFALNGVIQNCRMSCSHGTHASCGKSCDRHGKGSADCCKRADDCCKKADDCCAKTAAGDEQKCCKKHAAGDTQECCAKLEKSAAAAQEITVPGQMEKDCCKKGHDRK